MVNYLVNRNFTLNLHGLLSRNRDRRTAQRRQQLSDADRSVLLELSEASTQPIFPDINVELSHWPGISLDADRRVVGVELGSPEATFDSFFPRTGVYSLNAEPGLASAAL